MFMVKNCVSNHTVIIEEHDLDLIHPKDAKSFFLDMCRQGSDKFKLVRFTKFFTQCRCIAVDKDITAHPSRIIIHAPDEETAKIIMEDIRAVWPAGE